MKSGARRSEVIASNCEYGSARRARKNAEGLSVESIRASAIHAYALNAADVD